MASYFVLDFDTTAPIINIYAPRYTIRGISNDIEVISNEQLALYQEIYIIDGEGARHDLIFSYDGDRFFGIVNFDGYPVGSATIYATVKDTVYNISQQVYQVIELLSDNDALRLELSVSDKCRDILTLDIARDILILDTVRNIIVSDSDNELLISVSDYDPTI